MAEITFVLAPEPRGHPIMLLVDALRDELALAGVRARLSHDADTPAQDGQVLVLVRPRPGADLRSATLARTIVLVTDPPGTGEFDTALGVARTGVAAVLALHEDAVRELRLLGVDAHRLPVGWTERWTDADADRDRDRDLDVVSFGELTPRRAQAWAGYGETLAPWRTAVRLSDGAEHPDTLELLGRARVLLHVHAGAPTSFAALEAVLGSCRGAAVVAERGSGFGSGLRTASRHHGALVPGEHIVTGRVETLGHLAHGLLDDDERRIRLVRSAQALLREEVPLRTGVELLAEVADRAASRSTGTAGAGAPSAAAPADDLSAGEEDDAFPSPITDPEASVVRAALKELRLDAIEIMRGVSRLRLERDSGAPVPDCERVAQSAAYADSRPRVSVVTALFNHAQYVEEALASCAATGLDGLELIVVDDGSSDASLAVVRRWLDEHPDVPALLLGHPVNRGLGQARNTAIEHARGDMVFVLDSDNEVYPPSLERLVTALDEDPDAAFAYPILAMHDDGEPLGLRSALGWVPERLRRGNFVDAMALWRTDVLRTLGGFTTDRRLHGWEDYDLFCHAAERGLRGVQVPQVLARYRVSRHSMLSLTDLSWRTAVSVLVARYPKLMAGVEPPL